MRGFKTITVLYPQNYPNLEKEKKGIIKSEQKISGILKQGKVPINKSWEWIAADKPCFGTPNEGVL